MTQRSAPPFPFSAVVGLDDVKLALLLSAIDRRIGGVVLRGEKGSAKSTLARGLAALLPGRAPFVELPVSATEDRVVGSLDLESALVEGTKRFRPGLLASADGGVLYIDEINLLPDHLVDVLLDVAASGVNRVERESVSESHPSRFVLVGSMNPEEGELRPQLLDRFGLAVDVVSSHDPDERVEAVRRRIAYDDASDTFAGAWTETDRELATRLATCVVAEVPGALLGQISRLCVTVGSEGLRADLVIARAAAARAGWEGRRVATLEDVRRVAPLALAHRGRRSPLDSPGIDPDTIHRALTGQTGGPGSVGDDDATSQGRNEPDDDEGGQGCSEPGDGEGGQAGDHRGPATPDPLSRTVWLGASRTVYPDAPAGRRSTVETTRGRVVAGTAPRGPLTDIAVGATVRAAAVRRATADPGPEPTSATAPPLGPPLVRREDLRQAVRENRTGNLLVFVVDASASMGAERRMEAVKGAVLSLLLDAYQRRDRVAVVTFAGEGADVVLRPTGSTEIARSRLAGLSTGGRTPLAAGIDTGLSVATAASTGHQPYLVVVSDGRATSAPGSDDPLEAAMRAASTVRRRRVPALVLDVEDGPSRLGLAARLADAMGGRHMPLAELSAGELTSAVRDGLAP